MTTITIRSNDSDQFRVELLRARTQQRIAEMRRRCNAAMDRAYVLFRQAEREARQAGGR